MTTSRTGEAPVVAGRGGHVARRSSRGWRAVAIAGVAGAVLGAGAGALAATARPVHYRATVQEYIRFTEDSGAPDPSGPQKVRSYAGMVRSQRVLEPVITAQRLKTTVDELAGKVTAANPDGSLLVEISVTDTSAGTARTLAEAIGKQFASTVSQLEGRIVVSGSGTDQGAGQDSGQGSAQGSGQGSGQDGLPVSTATAVQVTAVGRSRLVRLEGPAWPWLAGGTLLGLAIGALGRAALRRRDPWIDEPTDLVPVTGAAPLGIVDDPRGGRRGAGAAVSAARSIAANLRFSDVDHPPRCLVIAGAYPDGAQTMVAADLAIGLARTGQKVVLVEADLAAFRLRTELRIDGRTGLTSILTGDSELDQVLVEWRDGVQVLPGGPLPPNPAQVMRSEQLASLLRVLKVRFDYVVLDGPPMLATPVAAELAARADGAVLVVTRGELRAGEVREALTALEQADARLLGTIFCDAPLRDGLRRGGLSRRTADPEAAPAEGRGYEPRGFETRTSDAPAPRRSGRSGSRSGTRSLEEFDDPSIVPLLLASPEELGREVESLPRHDLPSPYPGASAAPVHTAAQSPATPRRVPQVQVPAPRAEAGEDGAGGPPETVTLPPDDSYFGDLYEDTLPDDPFPTGRGPGGGSASRGGSPAWGNPSGGHQGQAGGPPVHGGHPGTAAQGGQPRYPATDQQPNRREDRPAAARTEQAPRQATLTEDPFPQVIPGPANPPSAGVVAAPSVLSAPPAPPTVVPPSVVPSVGVAPTPAQTPPGGLSPSNRTSPAAVPAPVPVTPVLPRPSLAPQPGALAPSTGHLPAGSGAATPAATTQPPATQLPAIQVQGGQAVVGHGPVGLTHSGHAPTVQPPAPQGPAVQTPALQTPALQTPALQTPALQTPAVQAPAGYPGAPHGYPAPAPQLPSWAELRREYEEPRPAYLNDPDLDRPYQPLRGPETVTEQPQALPRRAATERHRHQESYPEPYAMPQQRAAEPAHRPAPEQRSYQEHTYNEQPSGDRQYEDRPYDQYARRDDRRYGDQPAPSPYAEPAYQQPAPAAYQGPAYQEPAYREQQYPQVEYGREHVSEYGRGPEPVAGYPYPEAELPLPRRTVPPSMARPGMTVLPSQPPSGGSAGSGRRRARDTEPEPFLEAAARELTWEEQQGQRGDDGQYRPY